MIQLFCLCCLTHIIATSDECGVKNLDPGSLQFAVSTDGGDVTAPWIAAIGAMREETNGYETFVVTCSGAILTTRMIITAAHCFAQGVAIYPEYVRVGVTRIDQKRSQDRRIQEVNTHPDHNNRDWYLDIALAFLTQELSFNDRVSPLCLPEGPYTHPGDGVSVLVQGWGEDVNGNVGMEVSEARVSVRSKDECDYRFSQADPESSEAVRAFLPKLTSSELICADSTLDSQAGACVGDSGGPAFIRYFFVGRFICLPFWGGV